MSNHYYYFRIVYGKQLGQTKRVSPSTMYLMTLCKLSGLFNSQKLGCEGPKPGSGQTSRTSSGRTLRCGPLRPWLAGPDWMSGLVPAEHVRSFLEKIIH